MRKPWIGVTLSEEESSKNMFLRANYATSIWDAGGIPVILPYYGEQEDYDRLAQELDGFLFSGGVDVQPFLFGEETLVGCGSASANRDRMEGMLYRAVYAHKKPILGICRGIQAMNIFQGGTIWQDIPKYFPGRLSDGSALAHQQPSDGDVPSHTVQIEPDSLLYRLIGKNCLQVNSFHHQAVKDAAPGTKVSARSKDGMIEALEIPDYGFWLGVQWHPEYMAKTSEDAAKLFRGLVEAACHGI